MRIFVTAPDETGSLRKTRMTLVDCINTNELIRRIAVMCNYQQQSIIVKLKQELINIRIIQGWPLSIYPLRQGSQIVIELLPNAIRTNSQISSPNSPVKLLQIDEQLEIQIQDNNTTGVADQKFSFYSDSIQHDWTKYFEESLQQFLDAVRRQSLQDAAIILKQQPECNDEKLLARIIPKKINFLLNETGQCGRTALHWAIQQKNLEMVEFLLIKSSDPNVTSIDQYTPLQLSIILRASSIFQTLISHPKIDLNKVTKKGTALHLSIKNSLFEYAQKLIDIGANPQCEDCQGISALQLYKQMKISKLKFKNSKQKSTQIPYILRGVVFKVSSFASRLKERLLIANPFQNQFILFQQKNMEQKMNISDIKQVLQVKSKSWTMKKQFYYFQVICTNLQLVLCVKNSQIGSQWVENLNKCVVFCKNQEAKNKILINQQLIMVLDDPSNTVKVHKRKKVQQSQKQKKKEENLQVNRVSIFDLKPKQQDQKEPITTFEVHSEYKKQDEKSKIFEEIIIEETVEPLNSNIYQQNSEVNYLRQSQLLGSVISNNFLIKSTINKPQSIRQSIFQDRIKPIVCYKDFQMLRELGVGSFGRVFLARHKRNQKLYALKVLNKKKLLAKKQLKYAVGQATILKRVDSPFIVKLHYSFQTPTYLYIALDYCPNGDLSQKIIEQQDSMNQKQCRFYIAQIILAIEYLHKNNIIYRDLKPENILIDQEGFIKLTDFNLSRENNFSKSFCGSPAYLSPEMLQKKGVGPQADIYGIGCVFYEMIVGEPPFFDENIDTLYQNIKTGKLKFPSGISKSAKSLISSLLNRDIKKRIGVKDMKQIKKHEFFEGFDWKKLEKLQMRAPFDLDLKTEKNMGLEVIQQHGFQDSDYENSSVMINRIKNFTFARDPLDQ